MKHQRSPAYNDGTQISMKRQRASTFEEDDTVGMTSQHSPTREQRMASSMKKIQRLRDEYRMAQNIEDTWREMAQELHNQAAELLKEADRHEDIARSVASEQKAPISLKLLRQAYAYTRVASHDLATSMHAALPREVRDMIYRELLPDCVTISFHEPSMQNLRKMMGRPHYLYASWVGRLFAREALEAFYNNVVFRFTSYTVLGEYLHTDPFGLGVLPSSHLRRFSISVESDHRMANAAKYAMDNNAYEGPSKELRRARLCTYESFLESSSFEQPIERDETRLRLSPLFELECKAITLTLEVEPTPRTPELRNLSPVVFQLREQGWNVSVVQMKVVKEGHSNECSCWEYEDPDEFVGEDSAECDCRPRTTKGVDSDLTTCFDVPSDVDRLSAAEVTFNDIRKEIIPAWYRVLLHDHYNVYKTKIRENPRASGKFAMPQRKALQGNSDWILNPPKEEDSDESSDDNKSYGAQSDDENIDSNEDDSVAGDSEEEPLGLDDFDEDGVCIR
ncbi:hypothetical protein BU16DRAFT_587035 [Lophium mytilinum]|uniref:Uncharacterized protein n=1 Tax=Lophium mytilinum TaxID=390894 RepID=A0A6A6Q819_9PEZI|nr:hypothetical protein BU16DRAFT_587035 [Lophium mytilinum]